ncbi:hypothetical protein RJT34_18713 [Clitoria ternatea]|uniref:Uncharacterized protein n=1 Tax=Clitoria ternatea TaxID=43366 RepID=A0AAN9JCV3_CLITE
MQKLSDPVSIFHSTYIGLGFAPAVKRKANPFLPSLISGQCCGVSKVGPGGINATKKFWSKKGYVVGEVDEVIGHSGGLRRFNEICKPYEVKGGNFNHSYTITFLDMMDRCGLLDLSPFRSRFTWARKQ